MRKGKLEFIEKKKTIKKTMILELTPEIEIMLKKYVKAIDELLKCDEVPPVLGKSSCKNVLIMSIVIFKILFGEDVILWVVQVYCIYR